MTCVQSPPAAGEWSNPHDRTWRIDRPFGFSLTAQQVRTRYKSNRAQCMAWKMIGSVWFVVYGQPRSSL